MPKKWSPALFAAMPIAWNLVNTLRDTKAAAPPLPAADGYAHGLWTLITSGQKDLTERSVWVSVTLGAFLWALTALAWKVDKIYDLIAEFPRSKVLSLSGADDVFDQLLPKIKKAQRQIWLMYLRPNPVTDPETLEYWEKTTKLFTTKHFAVRRIASIDGLGKLEHLLENNSRVFRLGGKSVGSSAYQLRAFPHKSNKPVRMDVIDDTAFMLPTYEWQIMVTDEKVVRVCEKYYDEVWQGLEEWIILDTTRARPIANKPGRTAFGYSNEQLRVIRRIYSELLLEEPSEQTFKRLIEPHCELEWPAFKAPT